jgi:hypothetical protein
MSSNQAEHLVNRVSSIIIIINVKVKRYDEEWKRAGEKKK